MAGAVLEHDDLRDPRPISSRVAYHLSHCRDCLAWVERTRDTARRASKLADAEVPAGLVEAVLAVHEDFREGAAPTGRIDIDTIDVGPLGDADAAAPPALPLWPKLAVAAMIAVVMIGGWLVVSPSASFETRMVGDEPTPAVHRRKRAPAPPPAVVEPRERTAARETTDDELTASADDSGSQRRTRIWLLPDTQPARRRIREEDICRHATYEEAAACEKSGVYHHAMHLSRRRGTDAKPALPPLPEVPPAEPPR